ncbi:uncharacterized protein LOC121251571 [Juglans microcarpa x Juglans regia]|uniref:uncharacterized protein LOC121251571 n=1 Tax=Juglans microcarpa x Juglans regia TaxID=2249226 RepID=UPI001B7F723C|nr:uncharacterized protein LOC121251571 [Juglans microcarpa x Juglans regia]XP_041006785.1 uncharacterized protein LOC121251571 [Juglans microcarpa x Juglans regia]
MPGKNNLSTQSWTSIFFSVTDNLELQTFGQIPSDQSQNMPQDRLRSAVYRSFVTCDDPKGIVDCKTIRKSRTSSEKIEHKIESRRLPKNSNTSISHKADKKEMLSKGLTEEVPSPSSFQVMEVSRGAQKLNQTIDSWSKGVRYDGQSKDIAKDLLKEALDLQESLIMLGKLQEASDYMGRLKRKQNEKTERRRIDEMGIKRTYSSKFGYQKLPKGFQKPRVSVDGSSRNHNIEELKKVINDSLARQNLLPNPSSEEMGFLTQRDSDTASEIPSTSSNKSLMVHSSDFCSTESSLSSTASQKKSKTPNLIAKLMGLEELPSKTLQATLQEHLESERISSQRRLLFDIDIPKGSNPQSMAQHVDPELRTLEKILETMQLKGLLKSKSAKELKPYSYHSNDFHSKHRLIDEIPPVVLIKPMRVSCQLEELHTPVLQEEESLNTKVILTKPKTVEEPTSKTRKGALSSKRGKMEAAETPIKMISLEEGAKRHKEVLMKREEKEIKFREKDSIKLKASGLVDHTRQKKEAIGKKAKVASASRKPTEMVNVRAKIVSRSEDHAKANSIKPKKGSNIINNQTPGQPSSTQSTILRRASKTKTSISNSSDQKKNQMKKTTPVREPKAAKSVIESSSSKEDDKRIDLGSQNCSPQIRTGTALGDQLPIEVDKDASQCHIGEHCSNRESSLSDVTPLSPKHEMDDKIAEEAYHLIFHPKTDTKSFKTGTNLEAFLLSSPSFLSRAVELFDLNGSSSTSFEISGIDGLEVANGRLTLGCANELIERKSLIVSQMVHPLLLTPVSNVRACISIDKLVEEVCKGVENLRSYSKLAGESLCVDGLAMLERDINCNGVENAIWVVGWRHGFSDDDAEDVVNEIEKLVFNGLIEEVLT